MMFSFVTTFILTILSLLTLVVSAPIDVRDVYVPPVLYPHAGIVWQAGSTHNVTWDTSNPPKQITNKRGMIILAKGNLLIGLDTPLAKGFDILNGRQEVTIPADTAPGDDYSVYSETLATTARNSLSRHRENKSMLKPRHYDPEYVPSHYDTDIDIHLITDFTVTKKWTLHTHGLVTSHELSPRRAYCQICVFPRVNLTSKFSVGFEEKKRLRPGTMSGSSCDVPSRGPTAGADGLLKRGCNALDGFLVVFPQSFPPTASQSTSTSLQAQTASTMLALTILCISYFFSYVHATPLMMRDVFSPHITSPNETTIWPVGTQQTVTWETDNIPPDSQLTDPNGKVVLGHLGPTGGLNLDLDHPLAQNFKLRVGHVQVTVPSVPPRDDYIIVLFGDSGNTSPTFAITRITDGPNSTTSTTKPSTTTSITTQESSSAPSSASTSKPEPIPSTGSTTTTGGKSTTITPTMTLPVSSTTSATSPVSTQTTPTLSSSLSSLLSSLSSASSTSAADTAATTSNSAWASHRMSTMQTQLSSIGAFSLLVALLV
ncbi:hypothetical protein C0995_013850 [Termitomyces sp. Mi166|nr:hypothetical protein C0995_013850 [Termitomyces sp. Mi166\